MPKRSWSQPERATIKGGGSPLPVPGAWPRAAERSAPRSSIRLIYARGAVATVMRPLSVRQASADRPLEFDCRIPSPHLGGQMEFMPLDRVSRIDSGFSARRHIPSAVHRVR